MVKRVVIYIAAVFFAMLITIYVGGILHSIFPAFILGYIVGITKISRTRWIETGHWVWPETTKEGD